jgi:hypothetical protein
LRDLAAAIDARLAPAGVRHQIRFLPPNDVTWWSMAVDLDDGAVDDLYAAPNHSRIGVVPDNEESVSVPVAADYVAMCADLMTEGEWRQRLRDEQEADRHERREQRRRRWRARFGLER